MFRRVEWTREQREAIDAGSGSLMLSAAAGSGKTTVLVERILQLLRRGADIDRMLVVTFTRAAAADMRAKLSEKLTQCAAEELETGGDGRLREQLLRLERAPIATLHAFCADFLRAHFDAAGVDPAFTVLDDTVSARLRSEALEETLEEAYSRMDDDLRALDYGRGPAGVRNLVSALMSQLESRPDPAAYVEASSGNVEALSERYFAELAAAARRSVREAMLFEREALLMPGCPPRYRDALTEDMEGQERLLEIGDCARLAEALASLKYARLRRARKGEEEGEEAETAEALRKKAKDTFKNIRLLKRDLARDAADLGAQEDQRRLLGALALEAMRRFGEKKAELSGLTFSDLEHRTLTALRDDALSAEMKRYYEYVFVDEYQDTSDIQEAIVNRVAREGGLFVVGDVKQSIYRFRQAEPRLFIEKYRRYRTNDGGRLLPLTCNFRSAPSILAFVNGIFERCMTGGDSEIEYDDLARLRSPSGESEEGPPVEILILTANGEPGETDEAILELKSAERQALLIAERIRALMREDPTLRYRDFAVLTRTKESGFGRMLPILLAAGIPAYGDGSAGYFDSPEITLAISLLRLIDDRRRDIELLGVLHSPLVGLDAEELARIRIKYPQVPYADAAAMKAASDDSDPAAVKLRAFFERLEGWRLLSGDVDLGVLTRRAVEESGLYAYASALPGGAQRLANLDRLVDKAAAFDREVSGSLRRFLQHTEHLRQKDDESAHLLGENDDVVRMMTVHKSKGLEFRVVFGAMLERQYRSQAQETLAFHRDLGYGFCLYDPVLRSRRVTVAQSAIVERSRCEDAAEEMRILYVLLTRARERLILTARVRDPEPAMSRWRALGLAPFASGCHLDLIMSAVLSTEREGRALRARVDLVPEASLIPVGEREKSAESSLDAIAASPEDADGDLAEEIAWRYPDSLSAHKPLKLTVTGLLREVQGPEVSEELVSRPAFLAESGASSATGAERGTAYHRCMQLADLDRLRALDPAQWTEEIVRQLNDFLARRLITGAQRSLVYPGRIAAFFASPTGARLLNAREIHREWPFNVLLKAREALTPPEAGPFGEEELMVQGTIDCCFLEDGEWILLDFKTDRSDDREALRQRYREQLGFYALALERLTGRPVRERLLVLLGSGEVLDV